jgi:hypothetical protein
MELIANLFWIKNFNSLASIGFLKGERTKRRVKENPGERAISGALPTLSPARGGAGA